MKIDLSKDFESMDPDYLKTYNQVANRSSKISQEFSDEGLLEHDPIRMADLLLEQMKLYGFSDDEVQVFLTRFKTVAESGDNCPSLS